LPRRADDGGKLPQKPNVLFHWEQVVHFPSEDETWTVKKWANNIKKVFCNHGKDKSAYPYGLNLQLGTDFTENPKRVVQLGVPNRDAVRIFKQAYDIVSMDQLSADIIETQRDVIVTIFTSFEDGKDAIADFLENGNSSGDDDMTMMKNEFLFISCRGTIPIVLCFTISLIAYYLMIV
jgi:hypothetical protein